LSPRRRKQLAMLDAFLDKWQRRLGYSDAAKARSRKRIIALLDRHAAQLAKKGGARHG